MARQSSRFCRYCKGPRLHVKHQMIGDGVGCLLSVLSLGMFLLVWLPLALIDMCFQPWRCQTCGKKN